MQLGILSFLSGGGLTDASTETQTTHSSLLDRKIAVPSRELHIASEEVRNADPFDQLFEGKLSKLHQATFGTDKAVLREEGEQLPPAKVLSGLIQRLHLIQPETEGVDASVVGIQPPQLSEEHIVAMAKVLGVSPEALKLATADSTGQIFPHGLGAQAPVVEQIIGLFQELGLIGQQLQQHGLGLIDSQAVVSIEVEGEEQGELSLFALLSAYQEDANGEVIPESTEIELSVGAVRTLSQIFGVTEETVNQNLKGLQIVSLEDIRAMIADQNLSLGDESDETNQQHALIQLSNLEDSAKAPGLLQLFAHVTGLPQQEVWDRLEEVTQGETDLILDVALIGLPQQITPENAEINLALNRGGVTEAGLAAATAGQSNGLANGLMADGVEGVVPTLSNTTPATTSPTTSTSTATPTEGAVNEATSSLASAVTASAGRKETLKETKGNEESPLNALSRSATKTEEAPNVVEGLNRRISQFAANTREFNSATAASLRSDSIAPLMRESLERSLAETRGLSENTPSSLSVSALDSKLDFEARVREARNVNTRPTFAAGSPQEQVVVQVKAGVARGDTNIRVQLNPAELGRVDVRVDVAADGRASMVVLADNKDTLDLLRQDSRALEKAFADLGMDMSEGGMNFDLREQFAGNEQQEQTSSDNADLEADEFESMLEAAPDEAMAEALLDGLVDSDLNYMVAVDDYLNIKV